MAVSAAVSVASFSVVLTEAFAAVGLATIVPAGVVTLARMAKNAGEPDQLTQAEVDAKYEVLEAMPGADIPNLIIRNLAKSLPSLDLLLPKTATIHAEFTYEGSEAYSAEVNVGAMVKVVTIAAGYSALYESKSTNKITLDVEFASVNIPL